MNKYIAELKAFKQHLEATNKEIWDVLNSWVLYDGKFDVTITLNGKSICMPPSSIIYNSLDEMLKNQIAQSEIEASD